MAIIKCPECGKEISDKAKECPNCGYPMADEFENNFVRIKLSFVRGGTAFSKHKATISVSGKPIWEGEVGQIAELKMNEKTNIEVKYHTNADYFGGSCTGEIDPAKNKKYNVAARQGGFFKAKLVLQAVDVIDAD